MNLKLILQLSLFGLIMAIASISLIPEKTEPLFWLVIFIFCAFVIARAAPGKYFWHGFLVSIFNSVWITGAHVLAFTSYNTHHPDMAKMTDNMGYFTTHPRMFMLLSGIPFGISFGIVLGLFAFVASKFVKPNPVVVND